MVHCVIYFSLIFRGPEEGIGEREVSNSQIPLLPPLQIVKSPILGSVINA